jgi:hypothetical protein
MVKLAMTPDHANLDPAIRLDESNEFTNLHRQSLPSSFGNFETDSRPATSCALCRSMFCSFDLSVRLTLAFTSGRS